MNEYLTMPEDGVNIVVIKNLTGHSNIDSTMVYLHVVYTEPSFSDAKRVIQYLGNYTHRRAISNNRIQHIDNENVHFFYQGYKDQSKRKLISLSGMVFLRRFCLHILPKGFVKVRYYGVLSNRFAKLTAMYRAVKQ